MNLVTDAASAASCSALTRRPVIRLIMDGRDASARAAVAQLTTNCGARAKSTPYVQQLCASLLAGELLGLRLAEKGDATAVEDQLSAIGHRQLT